MEAEDQPQEEKPSGLDRKILIARDGIVLEFFTGEAILIRLKISDYLKLIQA